MGGESSEIWDGSGWQVVALATPTVTSGKPFTALGVSCPAAAGCIAVGDSADAGFAEKWDGTAWSNLPAIPKSQPVSGISCSSVSQCTAVGAQAYRWNGSTWALQKLPGGGYVSWTGVSCPTSSTCLAVGAWSPNKNTYVYAAQWSDGKWKDAGAPVDIGHLQGVSCPAPSACTVVGARGSGAPYAAQGSPASLKPQKVPAPPGPPSSQTLLGVSCAHSGSCVLVGSGEVGNKGTRGIAEEFTGKSWARLPAPPTGKGGWLTAVSCVSAADCEAVGYDDHTPLFGVHWDGQKWSRVTIPNRPYVVLSAISCVSASSCEAVGYYARPKNLQYVPFAVGWNGTAWTVQPVPSPSARSNTELASVSCASATECMAVGSAGNQEQGHSKAFAELWDGKSWTLQTLPKAPAGNGALSAVACPSPAMCLAAGGAGKNSLGESAVTLVEQWKAGAWTVLSTPSPFQIGFNGLSCPSTTDCTAVGGDSLTTPPFAEAWKGSAWQVQKVPGSTQLNSVSCTSAHYCEAAGTNYLGRNVVAGYRN